MKEAIDCCTCLDIPRPDCCTCGWYYQEMSRLPKNDGGGPAFPCYEYRSDGDFGQEPYLSSPGISLRDYFAGQAIFVMTRPTPAKQTSDVDLDGLGMAIAELPRFPWRLIKATDDDVVILLSGGFAHLSRTQEKALTYICTAVPELIRMVRERDEAIRDLRVKDLKRQNKELYNQALRAENTAKINVDAYLQTEAINDLVLSLERAEAERDEAQPHDLPYPDDPGATHWDGCWAAPKHHNCAIRKMRRAEAERDEALEKVRDLMEQRGIKPHELGTMFKVGEK